MNPVNLAALGYWIFPLVENTKIPPEGMHWRVMASTDLDEIRSWYSKFPRDNVGIDCEKSGLLVIDLDSENAADHWDEIWDDHEYRSWDDGRYPVVETRRGWHVYFRQPRGAAIGNPRQHRLGEKIDVKGDGGMVVGPGSVIDGHDYAVVAGDLARVPVCPAWLVPKLTPAARAGVTPFQQNRLRNRGGKVTGWGAKHLVKVATSAIANAPEGHRNDRLNEWAYKLRDVESDQDIADELLRAAVAAGLPVSEARTTIRSGLGRS